MQWKNLLSAFGKQQTREEHQRNDFRLVYNDWCYDESGLRYIYTISERDGRLFHRVAILGLLSYVPIELREDAGMITRTRVFLRGMYNLQEQNHAFDLLNMTAGVFHPARLGVAQLYGVVATGEGTWLPSDKAEQHLFANAVEDELRRRRQESLPRASLSAPLLPSGMLQPRDTFQSTYLAARRAFEALKGGLLGAFEQCRLESVDLVLVEWLRHSLQSMPYAVSIIGNPDPRENPRGMGRGTGFEDGTSGRGANGYALQQMEILLRGLASREQDFVMMLLTRHVAMRELATLLEGVATEASVWASRQRGTRAINLGLALPIVLGASTSMGVGTSHSQSA